MRNARTNDLKTRNFKAQYLVAFFLLLSGCTLLTVAISESQISKIRREALQNYPIGSPASDLENWYAARIEKLRISKGKVNFYEPNPNSLDFIQFSSDVPPGCVKMKSEIEYSGLCRSFLALNYCVTREGRIGFLELHDGGYC
jgi:hypothetical protein